MMASTVATLITLGASSLAAQTGFNGVITFRQQNDDGKTMTLVQTSKGHKVRLDGFGSDSGAMIIDGDAKVMRMVQPKEKKVLVFTQDDAKQMAAMMAPMAERMNAQRKRTDPGTFNFVNTGRKETVAGVRCEVWHGTYSDNDEKEEGDACLATGVGFDLAAITYANPMVQSDQGGWMKLQQYRQLVGGGKGVLKAVKIENGKPRTELEAVKVMRGGVNDAVFESPAGYQEVRFADMLMRAHNAMKKMQQGPTKRPPSQ
jgi:hypothetical protein